MSNSFLKKLKISKWYQDPSFIPYPSFFVDEATKRTLRPKLDQGSFDHECYEGVCEAIAEERGLSLEDGLYQYWYTDEAELELRVSMWQEINKAISEVLDV